MIIMHPDSLLKDYVSMQEINNPKCKNLRPCIVIAGNKFVIPGCTFL